VKRLCSRAMLINNGEIEMIGDAHSVASYYDSLSMETGAHHSRVEMTNKRSKVVSAKCEILNIVAMNADGVELAHGAVVYQRTSLSIKITFVCRERVLNPAIWVKFTRADGVMATSWLSHEPTKLYSGDFHIGTHTLVIKTDDLLLGDGQYLITVALFPEKGDVEAAFYNDPIAMWDPAVVIEVKRKERPLATIFDQPFEILGQTEPHV